MNGDIAEGLNSTHPDLHTATGLREFVGIRPITSRQNFLRSHLSKKHVVKAVDRVGEENKIAGEIGYFELTEGKIMQVLHKGPFEYEEVSLTKMQNYSEQLNLVKSGHHYEIYLFDFAGKSK
jgi:hypothetical protein